LGITHVFLQVCGFDSFEEIFDIEMGKILSFWHNGHPLLNKVNFIKENDRKRRILSSNFYRRVLDDLKKWNRRIV